MKFTDQTTLAELDEMLATYEARFNAKPVPKRLFDGVPVDMVKGAAHLQHAEGAVSATPTWELAGETRSRVPVVEVAFVLPKHQKVTTVWFETSPSRVIKINSDWQHAQFTAGGRTLHTVTLNRIVKRLVVRLEVLSQTFACGPLQTTKPPQAQALAEYLIPPAATAILGTGTVKYASGTQVSIDEAHPFLLLRQAADFSFHLQQGGVYARFCGMEPALVRIGNAWLPTPHTAP